MNPIRMLAFVLIVLGVLGLAYGGFSFIKDSHDARVGPIELSFKEKEHVSIPMWAGIGAVIAGVVLLVTRTNSR